MFIFYLPLFATLYLLPRVSYVTVTKVVLLFFSVDFLVSFDGTFVTGNQLVTGPIHWRIIITICPPCEILYYTCICKYMYYEII